MNEAYLEIVELDNGDIVLRPVHEEGEATKPLAVLKISEDTRDFLQDRYFDLAKCMFHAGINFVYSDDFSDREFSDQFEHDVNEVKTLH